MYPERGQKDDVKEVVKKLRKDHTWNMMINQKSMRNSVLIDILE